MNWFSSKIFYSEYQDSRDENISRKRWMYKHLLEKRLKDCFPYVKVLLRMYLSFMITNSSRERSFSKLKLIKNRPWIYKLKERLIFFFTLLSSERYYKTIIVWRYYRKLFYYEVWTKSNLSIKIEISPLVAFLFLFNLDVPNMLI